MLAAVDKSLVPAMSPTALGGQGSPYVDARDVLRATARRFPRSAWVYRNLVWRTHADKSQFGEQFLLSKHLPPSGVFLEVGAFQPVMFSNTWALEHRGWRGVAVDANPEYAFLWRLFRPRTPYWSVAITPDARPEVVLYVTDPRFGAVSSLHRDHVEKWSVPEGIAVSSRKVPALSVPELLAAFQKRFERAPDFVQFDCEGLDPELVQALLTGVPRDQLPNFLMVELLDTQRQSHLLREYYAVIGSAGVSHLFRKRAEPLSR